MKHSEHVAHERQCAPRARADRICSGAATRVGARCATPLGGRQRGIGRVGVMRTHTARDDALLAVSGVSMLSAVVDCAVCPVGTECGRGSTLERLPLSKGYYRLNAASMECVTEDRTQDFSVT